MGTFLLETTNCKDKETSSKFDPQPLPHISDSSPVFQSQKKKEIGVNKFILVLLVVLLYLLTASHTQFPISSKAVSQKIKKYGVFTKTGILTVRPRVCLFEKTKIWWLSSSVLSLWILNFVEITKKLNVDINLLTTEHAFTESCERCN